jgi:hypothetical protein
MSGDGAEVVGRIAREPCEIDAKASIGLGRGQPPCQLLAVQPAAPQVSGVVRRLSRCGLRLHATIRSTYVGATAWFWMSKSHAGLQLESWECVVGELSGGAVRSSVAGYAERVVEAGSEVEEVLAAGRDVPPISG